MLKAEALGGYRGYSLMSKNRMTILAVLLVAGLAGLVSTASATLKLSPPEKKTVQLLFFMEPDQNGKISKAEFMSFMESEFNKLDTNKDGALDLKEFGQARYYVHAGAHR
jgi:Ca2+-binding EF-hand superfamily protein